MARIWVRGFGKWIHRWWIHVIFILVIFISGQHEFIYTWLIGRPGGKAVFPLLRLPATWLGTDLSGTIVASLFSLPLQTNHEPFQNYFLVFTYFMTGCKRAGKVKNRSKFITGNFYRHFRLLQKFWRWIINISNFAVLIQIAFLKNLKY